MWITLESLEVRKSHSQEGQALQGQPGFMVANLLGFAEIVLTALARFCLSRSEAKAVLALSFAAFKLAIRACSGVVGGLGTLATFGGLGAGFATKGASSSRMKSEEISIARMQVFMTSSHEASIVGPVRAVPSSRA